MNRAPFSTDWVRALAWTVVNLVQGGVGLTGAAGVVEVAVMPVPVVLGGSPALAL